MPTPTLKVSASEAQSIRRPPEKKQKDKIKSGRAVVATPLITPEMLNTVLYDYGLCGETTLAAIDEAERSLADEGSVPVEDVRKNLRQWITA